MNFGDVEGADASLKGIANGKIRRLYADGKDSNAISRNAELQIRDLDRDRSTADIAGFKAEYDAAFRLFRDISI